MRLALSLNSPFQEQREQLMPIARRHPLERVLEACDGYAARTGKRVTVEYVLLRGVNISRAHAKELARIAQRLDGKVNLIEYNAVSGASIRFAVEPRDAEVPRMARGGRRVGDDPLPARTRDRGRLRTTGGPFGRRAAEG